MYVILMRINVPKITNISNVSSAALQFIYTVEFQVDVLIFKNLYSDKKRQIDPFVLQYLIIQRHLSECLNFYIINIGANESSVMASRRFKYV